MPGEEQSDEARCDFRGEQIANSASALAYALPTGPYWGPFQLLQEICIPERKLPQEDYGSRRLEAEEEAREEWKNQGHRRPIPRSPL